MNPRTASALLVLTAAGLVLLLPACLPHLEETEREAWTTSDVPGHLAVVFSGENDSRELSYTFSNDTAAAGYSLACVAFNIQLTAGTADISIHHGPTVLVQTSGSPGFGPWARFYLGEGLPGAWSVTVRTQNASGALSLNIDEVGSVPADRNRLEYSCAFPDTCTNLVSRSERYAFQNPNTTATYAFEASILDNTSLEKAVFTVQDAASPAASVQSNTFNGTATPTTQTASGTTAAGTAGTWTLDIDYTDMGLDASMQVTLD